MTSKCSRICVEGDQKITLSTPDRDSNLYLLSISILVYFKSSTLDHAATKLLDTLPVCQDFNRQLCNRAACKFVHLQEGHVEVVDMKVVVCRDAVKGKCARPMCKYYHIPIRLPPANEMAQPEHSLRAAAGRMLCGI
uniref:C3H1-type domain-containing protein n=2 Tax=Timema TaxID=61471 RepID=A0A7R9AMM2_TIMSH|nr:unnamed protein product [Timema shepardi]CAD7567840.1 unnamed protein product [Timema californicum]